MIKFFTKSLVPFINGNDKIDITLSSKTIPPNENYCHLIRNFRQCNILSLNKSTKSSLIERISLVSSSKSIANSMQQSILSSLNIYAPLIMRKKRSNSSQWITQNIKKLIGHRDTAYRKYRRNKSACNKANFKKLQNLTKHQIHKVCSNYIKNKLLDSANKSSNAFWRVLGRLNLLPKYY